MLLLVSLLACVGLRPDEGPTADKRAPVEVASVAVEQAPMPRGLPVTGSLVASQQVQLAADSNGVVVATHVERGQRVKKGDVLVTVDTRSANLSAAAGAAQARAQEAQLALAVAECDRADKLKAEGVISQAQLDRARASCDAQRAALEAARASAGLASTQASKTHVRAPFDGVVGERLVDLGAFVAAQMPVVSLYSEGLPRVRFTVGEQNASLVKVGAPVRARFPGGEDRWFSGAVLTTSGAVREMTRDIVVEAELEALGPAYLHGMSALVELELERPETPVVPASAVLSQGPVRRVFLVREGRAFEVVVRVGSEDNGRVAILEGVQAGEQVVNEPPATLKDGDPLALRASGS